MKGDNELRKATLNMKSDQDVIAQINGLFHPRSVAVVGAPEG